MPDDPTTLARFTQESKAYILARTRTTAFERARATIIAALSSQEQPLESNVLKAHVLDQGVSEATYKRVIAQLRDDRIVRRLSATFGASWVLTVASGRAPERARAAILDALSQSHRPVASTVLKAAVLAQGVPLRSYERAIAGLRDDGIVRRLSATLGASWVLATPEGRRCK